MRLTEADFEALEHALGAEHAGPQLKREKIFAHIRKVSEAGREDYSDIEADQKMVCSLRRIRGPRVVKFDLIEDMGELLIIR